LMASVLSGFLLMTLSAPVNRLFELYDQVPTVPALIPSELFMLVLVGAVLGLISAWYSAQLHLTRIQPK
jgi:cell division protein FtsX